MVIPTTTRLVSTLGALWIGKNTFYLMLSTKYEVANKLNEKVIEGNDNRLLSHLWFNFVGRKMLSIELISQLYCSLGGYHSIIEECYCLEDI